jgi:type III secretion system FlhB-like substrate exporter
MCIRDRFLLSSYRTMMDYAFARMDWPAFVYFATRTDELLLPSIRAAMKSGNKVLQQVLMDKWGDMKQGWALAEATDLEESDIISFLETQSPGYDYAIERAAAVYSLSTVKTLAPKASAVGKGRALAEAIERGAESDIVRFLETQSPDYDSAVSYAALCKSQKTVWTLAPKASAVGKGWALGSAITRCKPNIAAFLETQSPDYDYAIIYAAVHLCLNAVKSLAPKASAEGKGRALTAAIERGKPDMLSFLETQSPDYDSAVSNAAKYCSLETVRFLAPKASDKGKKLALTVAIERGKSDMVEFLNSIM